MKVEDQELIHRYIDGELSDAEKARVSESLLADVELRDYHDSIVELNQKLIFHYAPTADKPIPESLDLPKSSVVTATWLKPALAAAASIAVVSLVIVLYGVVNDLRSTVASLDAQLAELRNQTLEIQPSGKTVNWSDNKGSMQLSVTPVKTYRVEKDKYCRKYKEIIEIDGNTEVRQGIACRESKNNWPVNNKEISGLKM